jgi:hypothetical protein
MKRVMFLAVMVAAVFMMSCASIGAQNVDVSDTQADKGAKLLKFSEGLAGVLFGAKWGFVDTAGKWVIKPMFEEVSRFDHGYAPARLENRWGFIDRKGLYVINPNFDGARPFSEGLAPVKKGDSWGFIDVKGNLVMDYSFEELKGFSGGLAPAKRAGKWGFIDTSGKFVLQRTYKDADMFGSGLAPVKNYEDQWGYINSQGKFIITPQFDEARPFAGELALVRDEHKWGYINAKGKFVINPQFDDAHTFSENLAGVKTGGVWSYINKRGKTVISAGYLEAGEFNSSRALVQTKEGSCYIDHRGKKIFDLGSVEVAQPDATSWGMLLNSNGSSGEGGQDIVIINYSSTPLSITKNTTASAGMNNRVINSWNDYVDYNTASELKGTVSMQFNDPDPSKTDAFNIQFDDFPCPWTEQPSPNCCQNFVVTSGAKFYAVGPDWIADDQDHFGRHATNLYNVDYLSAFSVVSPRRTITMYTVNSTGNWVAYHQIGATLIILAVDTDPGYQFSQQRLKYQNFDVILQKDPITNCRR